MQSEDGESSADSMDSIEEFGWNRYTGREQPGPKGVGLRLRLS